MNKSAKIGLLAGLLLVGSAKINNSSVLVNTKYNLEELTTIPIVIPINFNKIKQNDSFNIPKFEAVESQESPEEEETVEEINIYEKYKEFKYPDELPQILKHAEYFGIEPELLMAMRLSENGRDSLAYGVLSNGKKYDNDKGYTLEGKFYPYTDEKEKQLYWAASTVKNNLKRFKQDPESYKDFISYLASKYAPIGVKNDPTGLNKNWGPNVKFHYEKFKN